MESLSIWTGGSSASWFDAKKLEKARCLLKCERKANFTQSAIDKGWWYLAAVDVARYGGNDTSVFVFKIKPRENGWIKEVVYTENITKMNLLTQAARVKQLVQDYHPKELVIDGNGVR